MSASNYMRTSKSYYDAEFEYKIVFIPEQCVDYFPEALREVKKQTLSADGLRQLGLQKDGWAFHTVMKRINEFVIKRKIVLPPLAVKSK